MTIKYESVTCALSGKQSPNQYHAAMKRLRYIACSVALVAGLGCPPQSSADLDGGEAMDGTSLPAGDLSSGEMSTPDMLEDLSLASCRTDKIAFSQAEGCLNDGSNEFCIPSGDPAVQARVKSIASRVSCAPGGGRAGCISGSELLCFFPTGPIECVARHGALTAEAWAQHCELAALPEVKRIVHTWFE
jgi:hypothetical protein